DATRVDRGYSGVVGIAGKCVGRQFGFDIGQSYLPLSDEPPVLIGRFDAPQLLGAAAMNGHGRRGDGIASSGAAQEIGGIIGADDVTLATEPQKPTRASRRLVHRAIHATMGYAKRLQMLGVDGPLDDNLVDINMDGLDP